MKLSITWLLGALLVLSLVPSVRAADQRSFQVIGSSSALYSGGQVLPAGTRIVVPEGQRLELKEITATGAELRECAGPYEGAVEACGGEIVCGLLARLLGSCGNRPDKAGPDAGSR